jgi:hypothetical protein
MPKDHQAAENKQDTRKRPEPRPIALDMGSDQAGIAELFGAPEVTAGGGFIGTQAARLGTREMQSAQRWALATHIGQVQGNQHLQRIVTHLADARNTGVMQRMSSDTLSRDVVTEAEQRTGSPREWAGLPRSEYPAVIEAITNDDREGAVRELATALGLPLDRVTIQVVDQLGVEGVPGVAAGVGQEIPYVMVTPQCGRPPEGRQHWEVHSPGEIRAYIQISTQVGDPPARGWAPEWVEVNARQRMTKLYTTLMHEYTHFLQDTEEGFHQGTGFIRSGDREYLRHEAGFGGSEVMAALNEIDASASEIENATRTALNISPEIRNVVSYMWDNYVSYHSIVTGGESANEGNVDRGVAARVYRNIQTARQLLRQYLESAEGQRLGYSPSQRRFIVDNECPRRYRPEWIERIVRGGAP